MNQHLSIAMKILLLCVIAALSTSVAAQQPYPSKPILILLGIASGGGSTNDVARVLGDRLRDNLGQPVVIENRPGANTIVATRAVAKAAPDGYTLLVHTGTHTIIPYVEPDLQYDPIKDFTAVATLGRTRFMMLVNPSVPVKTLKEFIAYAKARPGELNFGSVGTSSGSRLSGEIFSMMAGVKLQNVPYKGAAQVQTDLLGGRIQLSFNSPGVGAALVSSGKLKSLAIVGETRSRLVPDVPTFAEAGMPGFNEQAWYGLLAPANTPKPIVARIAAEAARMQASPEARNVFEKQGIEPFVLDPDQYTAFLNAEIAKFGNLIKTANIKFEN